MAMTDKETKNSTDLDLQALEVRVEELIRACSYLKDENKSLRTRQDNLVAERAALIEKTELARIRVEAMITRLKSMETPQ
jgi:cell division protein ZapB